MREKRAQQAEEARLIENVQGEHLHPAEEAVAVGKLGQHGATFQEIASPLGKPLRWVAQRKAVSQLVGTRAQITPAWIVAIRSLG